MLVTRGPFPPPKYAGLDLALDFKNGVYRDAAQHNTLITIPGYSFSRSGSKGVICGDGLVRTYAANTAAIRAGEGFYSANATTNLCLYSEAFNQPQWQKTNATVVADAVSSPAATLTADKLVEDTTAGVSHQVLQDVGLLTANAGYTASIFVKTAGRTSVRLMFHDGAGNGTQADLNLTTGVLTGVTTFGTGWVFYGAGAYAVPLANGWWRAVIIATTPATAPQGRINLRLLNGSGAEVYAGDGTSGVYVWGGQIIAGRYFDGGPYIATTTTTAAIGTDILTVASPVTTDEDFIMWGAFSCNYFQGSLASLDDGTGLNRVNIVQQSNGLLYLWVVSGGSVQAQVAAISGVQPFNTRYVMMARRRAGKWSAGVKRPGNEPVISAETAAVFPAAITRLQAGGGTFGGPENPVESVFVRKGSFSDAEAIAIMKAL